MNDVLSFPTFDSDGNPVVISFYGGVDEAAVRSRIGLGLTDNVQFGSLKLTGDPSHFEGGFFVDAGAQYGQQSDGSFVAKNLVVFPNIEVTGSWSDGSAGVSLAAQLASIGMIVNSTTP